MQTETINKDSITDWAKANTISIEITLRDNNEHLFITTGQIEGNIVDNLIPMVAVAKIDNEVIAFAKIVVDKSDNSIWDYEVTEDYAPTSTKTDTPYHYLNK